MHTCLIGQHVEVQKIDGHVYSGIFHDAIMDKEYGKVSYLSCFSLLCFLSSVVAPVIVFSSLEILSHFRMC